MSEVKTKRYLEIIKNNKLISINKNNFANLFSVADLGEKSYFNISKTIRFINILDIPPTMYTNYEIKLADTWTNISYNFYQTILLWWLICKFNNIINPFTELQTGKIIKIPSDKVVEMITNQLMS